MSKLTAQCESGQAGAVKVLSRSAKPLQAFRRLRPLLAAAGLALFAPLSLGAEAAAATAGLSDWSSSPRSAARLVAAGPRAGDPVRRAGVEVRLDPGTITYWRHPGDAGVAPRFDTTGSTNIAGVTVAYPAPYKLDEAGTEAFGYMRNVTFPLDVTLADPARAATLVVTPDYAVCQMLCLPAKARLTLPLPAAEQPEADAILDDARARVPRAVTLGRPGVLSIDHLGADPEAPPALRVEAHADAGGRLFVEAPEGWVLDAGAAVPAGAGRVSFPVAVLERPEQGRLAGLDLRLTLVDPSGAIDVTVRMP